MSKSFRIRTITAGVHLERGGALGPAEAAVAFLRQARAAFQTEGYEVQTIRLATQPLAEYLPEWSSRGVPEGDRGPRSAGRRERRGVQRRPRPHRRRASRRLRRVGGGARAAHEADQLQRARGVVRARRPPAGRPGGGRGHPRHRARDRRRRGQLPVRGDGLHPLWHAVLPRRLVRRRADVQPRPRDAEPADRRARRRRRTWTPRSGSLAERLDAAFAPVAGHGRAIAERAGWRYLGLDVSPAPGLDASIGRTIETLAGAPFGGPSTLAACAALTDVLKGLTRREVRVLGPDAARAGGPGARRAGRRGAVHDAQAAAVLQRLRHRSRRGPPSGRHARRRAGGRRLPTWPRSPRSTRSRCPPACCPFPASGPASGYASTTRTSPKPS